MLEMFQKSQELRQIHAAKTMRFLLDISFCEACIEYQRIAMGIEEDLVTVCFEHAPLCGVNMKSSECCCRSRKVRLWYLTCLLAEKI